MGLSGDYQPAGAASMTPDEPQVCGSNCGSSDTVTPKSTLGGCQVVIAHFAWFSQTCDGAGYAFVRDGGVTRRVCKKHFVAWEAAL